MKIQGVYTFNATPERAWAILVDPVAVKECIPGCQSLEPQGEGRYRAVMKVGIGPIIGAFEGVVAITDLQMPASLHLLVEGKGSPGFVKGEGNIRLEPVGQGTRIAVVADAQVGGTMAAVSQRLLGMAAKKLMDGFFQCLAKKC